VPIVRSLDGRQQLAPFYDLVCTGAYDLDHTMAMAVGGQFNPGAVGRNAWEQFARDIGIGKSLVLRTVRQMAARIPDVLAAQVAAVEASAGRFPRRAQVERTIRRRVRSTVGMLG